ncbi:hypothetical protein BRC81_05620 [Halobacteriales archaeon QS_1_68_20]|nr:MAG: hypothetical protein BRC81_05620 [Halobacteriales archaeon QS_1_68_20]
MITDLVTVAEALAPRDTGLGLSYDKRLTSVSTAGSFRTYSNACEKTMTETDIVTEIADKHNQDLTPGTEEHTAGNCGGTIITGCF